MIAPNKILLDLLSGDATADAIGERIRLPMLVIKAMCQRHETDGLLTQRPIANGTLIAWRLTDSGREVAHALNPQPQPA